jgi:hypothetical protein
VLGIQPHGIQRLAQIVAGGGKQAQLARVIGLGPLAGQVEQTQVEPGTALAMLLQIGTDTADQVGADQKQALVGQFRTGLGQQQTEAEKQRADTPGRGADGT